MPGTSSFTGTRGSFFLAGAIVPKQIYLLIDLPLFLQFQSKAVMEVRRLHHLQGGVPIFSMAGHKLLAIMKSLFRS